MNIKLDEKLAQKIKYYLRYVGANDTYEKFSKSIRNSLPKEINYKNFGANQNLPKRDKAGHFVPKYKQLRKFGYHSVASNSIKIRLIELVEENDDYIVGLDIEAGNKLKNFRKDRIVGDIIKIKQKL